MLVFRVAAVTVAAMIWTAAGSVAHAAAPDLAANPGALKSVPQEFQPKWRYWWPKADVDSGLVRRDLEAMQRSGFGGVEQVLLRNPNDWWTRTYRERSVSAAEDADDLGLTFDATLGPQWPMSSPAVDDYDKGLSMQEVVPAVVDVVGPSTYAGPLPMLDDTGLRRRTLVALTAMRLADQASPGVENPAAGVNSVPNPAPVVLDPASAVDLTAQVSGNSIRWQVPAGRWKLIATWQRPTGQRIHGDLVALALAAATAGIPASLPDVGGLAGPLVPDHFSRQATDAVLSHFDATYFADPRLAELMRKRRGHVFEDSLELVHGQLVSPPASIDPFGGSAGAADAACVCTAKFWTPTFLAEFQRRRGYDLAPVLPAIFNQYGLPGGAERRVRNDFERTLVDLLIDNHYRPIRAWANAKGLGSRAQGYDLQGLDKTRIAAEVELPDAESLFAGDTGVGSRPGSEKAQQIIDKYREISAGANVAGTDEIGSELGADLLAEFGMAQEDYKVEADRAFAGGATRMLVHGYAYEAYRDVYSTWSWPGWSAFNILFAQSWNSRFPEMDAWPSLAGYFGRIGAAMRAGRPTVDVVTLGQGTTATRQTIASTDLRTAFRRSGILWDRLDDVTFERLPAARNRMLLPDGPRYRAIVVDALPSISLEAAERLLAFAKAGVPVVVKGAPPATGTGYRDAAAQDARIADLFAQLLRLPNARRVDAGTAVVDALGALGVRPAMSAGTPLSILPRHRRTAKGDVWFLYNDSETDFAGELTFATTGRPAQTDPWTGEAGRLATYRRGRSTITLPVRLGAGQTTLLSFTRGARHRLHAGEADGELRYDGRRIVVRDTDGGRKAARLSDGTRRSVTLPELPDRRSVTGPWKLDVRTVGPDGDGRVQLDLPRLMDWRDIPRLRIAAGTGTYTTSVDVPAAWLAAGRGVLLDPGKVGGRLARLEINGEPVPTPSQPDGPRDITANLRAGDNVLRLVVATMIENQIAGRAQQGDLRYPTFVIRPLQPYGLLGDVRLVPFAERTLARLPGPCTSRRQQVITLRVPRGFKVVRASLTIGRRSTVVTASRSGRTIRVPVDLRGRPRGTTRVRLALRAADGRTRTTTRSYRLCVPSRTATPSSPASVEPPSP